MSQITTNSTGEQSPPFVPAISIDYRALLFRYRKNWYWFVLALLLFCGLAWLQLRYSTPEYAASASFIVQDPSQRSGVSTRQIGDQLGFQEETSIDDELNVLTSRTLMAEVVKSLGLDLSLTHIGEIRNTNLYHPQGIRIVSIDTLAMVPEEVEYGSVHFLSTAGGEHYLITKGDTSRYFPGAPFKIGNRNYALLTDRYFTSPATEDRTIRVTHHDPISRAGSMVGRLSARLKGNSNTVEIFYTDDDPYLAADVLNELINIYNSKVIDERSQTGEQTVAFIEERLDFVTRDLYSVEASISNLREREGIIVDNSVRGSDYLSQLNVADAQLSELEVRKSLIDEIRNQLQTEGYEPLSIASEIIDGTLAQLVSRYNEMIFARDQRMESVTINHPEIVTSAEQLNELKQSLVRSINTLYRESNERANRIAARIEPIERSMLQIPDNERQLLQVEREQQIKQNLFIYLMEKREEAAITVAAQIPNTRIVDPARPNRQSIYPKPTQNYIAAFALAFLLPGMFFFVREAFNTKIQLEKDVLRRTNLPIIGRIAKSSKGGDIVITRDSRSGVAEMFRIMRTNLSFLFPHDKTPVILLTSGVSGEGKTFVVSNLGYSLALGNKRTILIGADMRKPRLFDTIFKASGKKRSVEKPGLSNYLVGEADYEDIIQPGGEENLFIIDSGPIPPDPSELLLRPRTEELFKRLRKDFDVVIVDAPPIGLVTDALQLKNFVDISLYVIRLGYTPKTSLDVLTDAGKKNKLPNLGIVVNGLQPKRDYGYGYAQGYYNN